ncbi:MAG: hypothetical protein KatS3mg110_0917 [Pirellulaceae bacterium]|nr:MAG: hypothetical protein KatS3mg110_0917 [Pirellulaceae bacterium]
MATDAGKSAKRNRARDENRIILISYPKVVFLYPSYIAGLILSIWMAISIGDQPLDPQNKSAVIGSWIFLAVLGTNLVVLSFDFPRTAWLTLLFVVVAIVLGLILLSTYYPDLLPAVGHYLAMIRPMANAAFYGTFVAIMTLVYIFVWCSVQFDYWEVRPNELLHHHGIMADLERFPAPNLRVTKEINDVFEYMLLGAGRLVLRPSGEQRPIILENVPFITKKEEAITNMLSALQVKVAHDNDT